MANPTPLTPVLSRFWDNPSSWTLQTYRDNDGYRALARALKMTPEQVTQEIRDSGLRGRGGAGFGTGMKWGFIPKADSGADAKPHYLVINADESEPGTCKDIPLMFMAPHFLVEGAIIASRAIGASHAGAFAKLGREPSVKHLAQRAAA